MKRMEKFFAAAVMAGVLCFGTAGAADAAPMMDYNGLHFTDDWDINIDNPSLTEDEQQRFEAAIDGLVGCTYDPVAMMASQSVPGGTIYCVLCRLTPVTLNPVPHWGIAYVHYDEAEGVARLLDVKDIDLTLGQG